MFLFLQASAGKHVNAPRRLRIFHVAEGERRYSDFTNRREVGLFGNKFTRGARSGNEWVFIEGCRRRLGKRNNMSSSMASVEV